MSPVDSYVAFERLELREALDVFQDLHSAMLKKKIPPSDLEGVKAEVGNEEGGSFPVTISGTHLPSLAVMFANSKKKAEAFAREIDSILDIMRIIFPQAQATNPGAARAAPSGAPREMDRLSGLAGGNDEAAIRRALMAVLIGYSLNKAQRRDISLSLQQNGDGSHNLMCQVYGDSLVLIPAIKTDDETRVLELGERLLGDLFSKMAE